MTDRPDWDSDERDALAGHEEEVARMRARHAGDPPLELLRAARADAVPPELQVPVAQRLSDSEWSRTLLSASEQADVPLGAADLDRLFDRISTAARRPRPTRRLPVWVPLLAAASIVLVASVWMTRRPVPPPVAATPDAARAMPPRAPFTLPLELPEIRVSAAALTWRGARVSTSLADDLAPGLDAFRRSDFGAAAAALEGVERRFPGTVEAPFYRGVALLFLHDPANARIELNQALRAADETFSRDVAWYLAVAEQRAGDPAAARARLDVLCRGTGARTAQACDAVKALDRDLH